MKLLINFQSVSDIITNSSSEVFCKITADKDTLTFIENLLQPLFGDKYEYDMVLKLKYKEDEDPRWCSSYEKLPEQWLELDMPYRLNDAEAFYKAGLEAILKENFNGQYEIIYED